MAFCNSSIIKRIESSSFLADKHCLDFFIIRPKMLARLEHFNVAFKSLRVVKMFIEGIGLYKLCYFAIKNFNY